MRPIESFNFVELSFPWRDFRIHGAIYEGQKVIHFFSDNFAMGLFAVSTILLFGMLFFISLIDIKSLRIPDALSLPLIGIGLMLAVITSKSMLLDHVIGAAVAYLLFAGLGEVFFRVRGIDGLGLGDAKLFAAAGAWLGWQNLPLVLLLATFGGLVQALLLQKQKPPVHMAFGPWIALAIGLVWIQTHFMGYGGDWR